MFLLSEGNFFNICFTSMYIVLNKLSEYINSKVHDQVFVNEVLNEMIVCTEQLNDVEAIIIVTIALTNTILPAQYFYQYFNTFQRNIIHVYGKVGHGKGEVSHVKWAHKGSYLSTSCCRWIF